MKNFVTQFFVANRISDKCVTIRGRKNPFEFRFGSLSPFIFIKNYASKFFVANRIFNECNTTRAQRKPFVFIFWTITRNLCIFMKNFARKFFVGNWILKKCVTTRVRKNLSNSGFGQWVEIYVFRWKIL